MTNPTAARSDTVVLLICVTVLVSIVVAVAALVWVFSPPGVDPTPVVATLVATLPPTIAGMAAVVKVGGVSSQVADVQEDTNRLANGLGDSKIRAAVADVLPDHLVDPAVKPQLEADRLRRAVPEDHQ